MNERMRGMRGWNKEKQIVYVLTLSILLILISLQNQKYAFILLFFNNSTDKSLSWLFLCNLSRATHHISFCSIFEFFHFCIL